MSERIFSRRALATVAVAIAASVGSVAGVSLAQGGGAGQTASTPSSSPPGGILAEVHRALAGLVADGTIDQRQADAVQQEANAGSINPKELVDSGALTDAQMRAVAAQLDQVKRSYDG